MTKAPTPSVATESAKVAAVAEAAAQVTAAATEKIAGEIARDAEAEALARKAGTAAQKRAANAKVDPARLQALAAEIGDSGAPLATDVQRRLIEDEGLAIDGDDTPGKLVKVTMGGITGEAVGSVATAMANWAAAARRAALADADPNADAAPATPEA